MKNLNHKTDRLSNSGIYQLKCECGTKYIGKTTRKFKQRYQEHKHSFIYNNPDRSKFAAHLLQEHHPLNLNCFTIIKIIADKNLLIHGNNTKYSRSVKS